MRPRPSDARPFRKRWRGGQRVLVLGLATTGLSVGELGAAQGGEARVADTRTAPPGEGLRGRAA